LGAGEEAPGPPRSSTEVFDSLVVSHLQVMVQLPARSRVELVCPNMGDQVQDLSMLVFSLPALLPRATLLF
jgi:hypothetical protein